MLGLGKNKKTNSKNSKNEQEKIDPLLAEQIHTMPERFYIKPAKKRSSLTVIILVGVLVILILAAVAVYFFVTLSNQSETISPVEQPTNNQPVVEVEPLDNLNSTTTDIVTEIPVTDVPTSTDEIIVDPAEIEAQELSTDQDRDGLTLVEEQFYKTNPELSDTDGDTYSDGSEVVNGYNPATVGTTLEQSGVFRKYSNNFYTINYPNGWELRDQSPGNTEVLFIANSSEFLEILILQNLNNLTLDHWFALQFPEFSVTSVNKVTIGGLNGILHPTGLTYYLLNQANPNSIYIITYNLAGISDLRYLSTFRSVANSFRLIP